MAKQEGIVSLELFEVVLPGKIVGKAVIDSQARMIGVIRHISVSLPSGNIKLIVKGLDSEFDLDINTIKAIGNVVQLNVRVNHIEPIDLNDVIRLRDEIRGEVLHFYKALEDG